MLALSSISYQSNAKLNQLSLIIIIFIKKLSFQDPSFVVFAFQ